MKKPKTDDKPMASSTQPEPNDPAEPRQDLPEAGERPEAGAGDSEIEKLKAQADDHWQRVLRVTAEFENFRKRAAREKEEAVRYANHRLLERLLPVLDSFDMAAAAANAQQGASVESLKEGIGLVLQQLRAVLADAGLEEIQAHGQPFDPNLHEAVSQVETDEVEEGHVAQQIRKGYLLRDRLVRPSSVIVAKKPAA